MFTGIIQAVGEIIQVNALNENPDLGFKVSISPGSLEMTDVSQGDSISINGVCLTVTSIQNQFFTVDISPETLKCAWGLNCVGQAVNLEKALRLSDRLGGHLVSGHVDAPGEVTRYESFGDNFTLVICCPKSLMRYIVCKGSITVNGVSLTVNEINDDQITINLIPHTLAMTNLGQLKIGIPVNLEVDMLARYVENLLQRSEV